MHICDTTVLHKVIPMLFPFNNHVFLSYFTNHWWTLSLLVFCHYSYGNMTPVTSASPCIVEWIPMTIGNYQIIGSFFATHSGICASHIIVVWISVLWRETVIMNIHIWINNKYIWLDSSILGHNKQALSALNHDFSVTLKLFKSGLLILYDQEMSTVCRGFFYVFSFYLLYVCRIW